MQIQTEKHYYTREEYLALEEKAEYKNEYRNGIIVPIPGGTTNHNKIAGNFFCTLKVGLRNQNYEIFMGDVRLWIPVYSQYTYPDIFIIQGKPVYEGIGTTMVTNPLLIVEILSTSTKNYDRGEKFKYYRSIPTLREYIMIDQYKYYIEQYTKTPEGKWLFSEYESTDSVLILDSIEFKIPLSDIYERVNFEISEYSGFQIDQVQ